MTRRLVWATPYSERSNSRHETSKPDSLSVPMQLSSCVRYFAPSNPFTFSITTTFARASGSKLRHALEMQVSLVV